MVGVMAGRSTDLIVRVPSGDPAPGQRRMISQADRPADLRAASTEQRPGCRRRSAHLAN
jgi:hypothetical protein